MPEKKMRVAIYCRVATQSQLNDGPLEMQRHRLHQYAQENGLEIIGEVRAYEKGLTMDRPGWKQVISLASETHADAVLVTELGRVARSPGIVMDTMKELAERKLMVFSSDYNLSSNTRIAENLKRSPVKMAYK